MSELVTLKDKSEKISKNQTYSTNYNVNRNERPNGFPIRLINFSTGNVDIVLKHLGLQNLICNQTILMMDLNGRQFLNIKCRSLGHKRKNASKINSHLNSFQQTGIHMEEGLMTKINTNDVQIRLLWQQSQALIWNLNIDTFF